jgi:hypothetical protein
MTHLLTILIYIIIAVVLVSIVATAGAWASHKLNFNYGYLTIATIIIYTGTTYLIAKQTNLYTLIYLSMALVCIYDAIVGWKLALFFNARMNLTEEQMQKVTIKYRLSAALLFLLICGIAGVIIARV